MIEHTNLNALAYAVTAAVNVLAWSYHAGQLRQIISDTVERVERLERWRDARPT